jgi:hypothetical protein
VASLLRRGRLLLAVLQTLSQALACVGAATGLLYLLRPYASARGIVALGDALPLDELPNRASVSIPAFVAVWAAAAVSVGLLAPGRPTPRRLVAFAGAVWLWDVAGTTVSLLVVRQESLLHSLVAALSVPAVYVAAVLSGLAAALAGSLRAGASSRAEPSPTAHRFALTTHTRPHSRRQRRSRARLE